MRIWRSDPSENDQYSFIISNHYRSLRKIKLGYYRHSRNIAVLYFFMIFLLFIGFSDSVANGDYDVNRHVKLVE